jgi:hypothetical protein
MLAKYSIFIVTAVVYRKSLIEAKSALLYCKAVVSTCFFHPPPVLYTQYQEPSAGYFAQRSYFLRCITSSVS